MAFTQNISQLLQNSVDYEGNRLSLKQLLLQKGSSLFLIKRGKQRLKMFLNVDLEIINQKTLPL
jgi:hypothetical protein